MSKTPFNEYVNKRIDEIHDEIVKLTPFSMLVVWVDADYSIVSESQYTLPGFNGSSLSVGDVADIEIDSVGVFNE